MRSKGIPLQNKPSTRQQNNGNTGSGPIISAVPGCCCCCCCCHHITQSQQQHVPAPSHKRQPSRVFGLRGNPTFQVTGSCPPQSPPSPVTPCRRTTWRGCRELCSRSCHGVSQGSAEESASWQWGDQPEVCILS